MNNGLRGRYLDQLEQWNRAREFAAELVEAFCNGSISDVLSKWSESVTFPPRSEIKKILNSVVFMDGRSTIDIVARSVIDWEGWKKPAPSMNSSPQITA